jgi:hypothetical protein
LQKNETILQKRYFLIINADSIEKANRGYTNITNDLSDAGINLKPCLNEDVEICLKKLIPTYKNEHSIKFNSRNYELIEKEKTTYYRTVMVTSLPKNVGQF